MSSIKTFRDPDASLWQAAVDAVVTRQRAAARAAAPGGPGRGLTPRPGLDDAFIAEAARAAAPSAGRAPLTRAERAQAPPGVQHGLVSGLQGFYERVRAEVASAAEEVEQGLLTIEGYRERIIAQFGQYDPRWAECAIKYADYYILRRGEVPYRRHQNLSDFDIQGKLPAKSRVALISDWATGLEESFNVLRQVAAWEPNVVIHLGDIYYAGTQEEVQRTFWMPVQQILRPQETGCTVLSLAGNHDLYSGGQAYYALLDQLGQPASYFALINDDWQFLALDTGLNGHFLPDRPTFLADTELDWLRAKLDGAGNRRSILLSHHQLFSAYEETDGHAFNAALRPQIEPLLPRVPLWLWGHEHNFVVYEPYQGCRARCIGHGAIPVAYEPMAVRFTDVPILPKTLGQNGAFYSHGYAIVDLDGPQGRIAYYQDSDPNNPIYDETI
jgi:hypothetical protein